MPLIAVTVLGHDRPGIIAEVTGVLGSVGVNLEDSTMTLLRGHFAFMLLCASPSATAADVEAVLAPVAADGTLLVTARPVPDEDPPAGRGPAYLLTVHGGDRPGIVSAVTAVVAAAGGNITDLSTRLAGGLYVVVAEVDLPVGTDVALLEARLAAVAHDLGVEAGLRAADPDLL